MLFSGAVEIDIADFFETKTEAAITPTSNSSARSPPRLGAMFLENLEAPWNLGISNSVAVKINHVNADAVFHFALAKIVKEGSPARVLFQIVGHVFRQKDVSRVAAIHHSLGDVDSSTGNICLLI
jgi:hypothetical protein